MEKPEQIVVFKIENEHFALPVLKVREIITTNQIQSITSEKEEVNGMVMIRGNIIPIIDFRKILSKEPIEKNANQRVIVMANEDKKMGLLVDHILQVTRTTNYEFNEAPKEAHKIITHILKDEKTVIYLIDDEKIGEVE